MSSKKLNYYHRGYVYKSKIKINEKGDIEFIHDISKRDSPDNVVFFYYGINSRPLKEIELLMSKIKWKDLPHDFDYEITWHDAIKNIEKLVDEKRLELMKDQDFHNAHLLDKCLNVIKRGY